jgi:signal transduction histidine kinase
VSTRNRFRLPRRRAARDGPRRRLFIKYLIVLVGLVGAAVLVTSLVALVFTYRDTEAAASRQLEQRAYLLARSLSSRALLAATEASEAIPLPRRPGDPPPTLAARRAWYGRHLGRFFRYRYVDPTGRERLCVSAYPRCRQGPGPRGYVSGRDLSRDPAVRRALASTDRGPVAVFGPVSHARPPAPSWFKLLPIAVREGLDPRGVTLTELEPNFIEALIGEEFFTRTGDVLVYLVDSDGRLLAHPDESLLAHPDEWMKPPPPSATLPGDPGYGAGPDSRSARRGKVGRRGPEPLLPQVAAAVAGAVPGPAVHYSPSMGAPTARQARWEHDARGRYVLSASAPVAGVGWQAFAEERRDDVLRPVYDAALRTGIFLAIFLALAVLASALLARRMVRPIARIESGARRIGEGALDERIELNTGDELQSLAEEFNRMAGQLEDLYADLERRVEDRTRDLSAALRQNATLLRELERKSRDLEAASQHKSEFLATMSHELRTPLNAIIGFSEVLRERMFGELNDRQAEYLEDIHVSGRHLLTLIDDILDLAKVESGRMELELDDVDVGECLETGFMMVRGRAKRRGVRLEMDVEPGLDQVPADGRKLKQVVFNLLANAVRFTPEGGLVEASARRVDGELRIAVRDSGPGIASEDQERIFETFQQAGNGGAREGSGLGLALSRAFAELHGGRLWVESRLGEGSTFVLALPLVPAVAGR